MKALGTCSRSRFVILIEQQGFRVPLNTKFQVITTEFKKKQFYCSNNYGTLNRERQERLQENEEILERQREELRQLGVL